MLCGGLLGCGTRSPSRSPAPRAVLRVASTTSTRDSGLFDVLLPKFERSHRCRVDLIAVGTGAALKLGAAGDVDVLICHARDAEKAFMAAQHGVRHEPLMHNYFLIAGPHSDPAGIRGLEAAEALRRIARSQAAFVSRGDDSGTHIREKSLWKRADVRPNWKRYVETGRGMGATLAMADEMRAYVLIDEGTWLKQRRKYELEALVERDPQLKNPYAVLLVNPRKSPAINHPLANAFADFLLAEETQRVIGGYQIGGSRLFRPDRLSAERSKADRPGSSAHEEACE